MNEQPQTKTINELSDQEIQTLILQGTIQRSVIDSQIGMLVNEILRRQQSQQQQQQASPITFEQANLFVAPDSTSLKNTTSMRDA